MKVRSSRKVLLINYFLLHLKKGQSFSSAKSFNTKITPYEHGSPAIFEGLDNIRLIPDAS
jgi:hypothetical protein